MCHVYQTNEVKFLLYSWVLTAVSLSLERWVPQDRRRHAVSVFVSSLHHDREPQLFVLLSLLLLLPQCFVFPLGNLQVLWILAPAPVLLRCIGWWWSLAQTYFGHHQTWWHASPAYLVQRQQAVSAQRHAGCQHHIWQRWHLQAATLLLFLENQRHTTTLEETLIVLQAFKILRPLVIVPQDIWDSWSMFAYTWWAPWAYCAAGSCHKRTCQCCGQTHHVV